MTSGENSQRAAAGPRRFDRRLLEERYSNPHFGVSPPRPLTRHLFFLRAALFQVGSVVCLCLRRSTLTDGAPTRFP